MSDGLPVVVELGEELLLDLLDHGQVLGLGEAEEVLDGLDVRPEQPLDLTKTTRYIRLLR